MPDATCLGPPKTCGPDPALLAAAPSQGLWTSPCLSVPVSGGLRTWQGPVPAGEHGQREELEVTRGRVPRCTRPGGFLSRCRQDTLLRGAGQCEEPRGGRTQSPAPREQHSRGQGSIPHTPLLCHVPSRVPTPQLLKQCPHFLGMRGHRACPALSPVPPVSPQPPGGCTAAVPVRSRDAPPLARCPVASPSLQLPARGAEQRCLRPHAHPASLSCSVASSFWGCHRLEAGLRAAPRGTATEGLRALRVAGPAPFISLTHCPWIATCQCICMYIAVHTGESLQI